MSLGPLGGVTASAAGAPLAQTTGSDIEKAQQDAGGQTRRVQADQKADNASGIGEADGEDHETAERDADGRRLWEPSAPKEAAGPSEEDAHAPGNRRSKDSTGQSGNLLDLSG